MFNQLSLHWQANTRQIFLFLQIYKPKVPLFFPLFGRRKPIVHLSFSSMEDPNPAQPTVTEIANPPNSEDALPPQRPPSSLPPKTKKRPLDNDIHISNSSYFKVRAVLKEIRPLFLEVHFWPICQSLYLGLNFCKFGEYMWSGFSFYWICLLTWLHFDLKYIIGAFLGLQFAFFSISNDFFLFTVPSLSFSF